MRPIQISGYSLMRNWYNFSYEQEGVKPIHHALYGYCVELCNRLCWKPVFGLPTYDTMLAIGIKDYKAYKKALLQLEAWGVIKLVERSKNQHTSNQIRLLPIDESKLQGCFQALVNKHEKLAQQAMKDEIKRLELQLQELKNQLPIEEQLLSSALEENTKAPPKAPPKQTPEHPQSTLQSTPVIDKPTNLQTNKPTNRGEEGRTLDKEQKELVNNELINNFDQFEKWFWKTYDYQKDVHRTNLALGALDIEQRREIFNQLPRYISSVRSKSKKFWISPFNYLNHQRWKDEIVSESDPESEAPPKYVSPKNKPQVQPTAPIATVEELKALSMNFQKRLAQLQRKKQLAC